MSAEIILLKPCGDAATSLRNIADMIDSGEITATECTVIAGLEVFHCGETNDARAVESAVFNMTFGVHKLMRPVIELPGDP